VKYLFWRSKHVNGIAAGYVALRERGLIDASKVMVRPILETTFYVAAVLQKRGFLFRKAYSEALEEQRIPVFDRQEVGRELEAFKAALKAREPDYPIEERELSAWEAANAIGWQAMYGVGYRVYCQLTHGTLRAFVGEWNVHTDPNDSRILIWCLLIILDQLNTWTPADIPDLMPLWEQSAPPPKPQT
jgi:Family of unknown function (DUF5677)